MLSPNSAVTLILAAILMIAGGAVGYEIGKGIGYLEGKNAGESTLAASLNAQGSALAKEAAAARDPALAPGSFARLLKDWCRDCK